jgi:hypothetical protein
MEQRAIPNDASLARFLRKTEIYVEGARVVASYEAFNDGALSVDWLELTTLAEAYGRLPYSAAHAELLVSEMRQLGEQVDHDPTPGNVAHSLCRPKAPMPNGRRHRNAYTAIMTYAVKKIVCREDCLPDR